MLLYLKARDAHIVHDRAYSNAPRSFNGLGKRRRAERLADRDDTGSGINAASLRAGARPVARLMPDARFVAAAVGVSDARRVHIQIFVAVRFCGTCGYLHATRRRARGS